MKKILISSIAIALLNACNNTPQQAPVANAENQQAQPITIQKPEPYFNGSGEGMTISMESSPDGSFPVKMNFKDQVFEGKMQKIGLGTSEGNSLKSGEAKFTGTLESAGSGVSASVSIIAGDCKNSDGGIKSHSFVVEFDQKSAKGCGQYAE